MAIDVMSVPGDLRAGGMHTSQRRGEGDRWRAEPSDRGYSSRFVFAPQSIVTWCPSRKPILVAVSALVPASWRWRYCAPAVPAFAITAISQGLHLIDHGLVSSVESFYARYFDIGRSGI